MTEVSKSKKEKKIQGGKAEDFHVKREEVSGISNKQVAHNLEAIKSQQTGVIYKEIN